MGALIMSYYDPKNDDPDFRAFFAIMITVIVAYIVARTVSGMG